MGDPATIIELRQLLAERFPHPEIRPGSLIATGIPRLDEMLEGGLWKGALTELIAPPETRGSALCIAALLRNVAIEGFWMALIDGRDSFDPQPMDNTVLAHLLWVRCSEAGMALRAADLLLRDGNLPLVVLDLRLNPVDQLRKIPSSTWYRLQRIANVSTLLAITPYPMIPSAHVKVILENRFTFSALNETQNHLLERLQIRLARRRFLATDSAEAI